MNHLDKILTQMKNQYTVPSFTYVGIGSCPHVHSLEEYNDQWNQILPVFVRDILQNTHIPLRILHFDPAFDYQKERIEFLQKYFESINLNLVHDPENNIWSNDRMSITICGSEFNHTDPYIMDEKSDDWFLHELANHCISEGSKLVVQEFTGKDLDLVFKAAFRKSSNPKKFKNLILFDITYGTNSTCSTDMSMYKPFYSERENFCNLLLYTPNELKRYIGMNPKVDEYIKMYFTKQYNLLLNKYHVDYRRRLRGETVFSKNEIYNDSSDPELIMELLETELCSLIPVFRELKIVNGEKESTLYMLFETYKLYKNNDLYRWYDLVKTIINA